MEANTDNERDGITTSTSAASRRGYARLYNEELAKTIPPDFKESFNLDAGLTPDHPVSSLPMMGRKVTFVSRLRFNPSPLEGSRMLRRS